MMNQRLPISCFENLPKNRRRIGQELGCKQRTESGEYNNRIAIDNLIFETIIYSHFITKKTIDGIRIDRVLPSDIVELKLWHGEASHDKALEQIAGYLDSKGKNTGYFFRKENNTGKPRAQWVEFESKRILDVMVGV
jgi:hypothetical protein